MIEERYISFEVAKLLKEKGFNEPCRSYFIDDTGDYRRCAVEITNEDCSSEQLLRPTLYMTMEWLRKKYKLFLGVGFGNDDKGEFLYMVDIYDLNSEAIEGKYKPIVEADEYLTVNPKTPAEAIGEALMYSLENLV